MFLIIGSAHRDILADYASQHRSVLDKPGTFTESIGGTACNIARNLAHHGNVVNLYTHVCATGLNAKLLVPLYEKYKFDPRGLVLDHNIKESVFIGIREAGELVTAVSVIGLEQSRFDFSLLRSLMESASVVVADANLTGGQLEAVFALAHSLKKPLSIAGVSEAKAYRTLSAIDPAAITTIPALVFMNHAEATAFLGQIWSLVDPSMVCRTLSSAAVCITQGSKGFSILTEDNQRFDYPAPQMPVVSTTGAGDALMAALLHYRYVDNGEWHQRGNLLRRVEQYIAPILSSSDSSP